MNRKDFIKLSSLSVAALLVPGGCGIIRDEEQNFDITVLSDMNVGHLIRTSGSYPINQEKKIDTLIVGAGIAGLATAYKLKAREPIICELSSDIGGSSGAHTYGALNFSQGAHYDLAYPANYGQEVLELLKELRIIEWNESQQLWGFTDKQFLIDSKREGRCYESGKFREDVIPDSELKRQFIELIHQFSGKIRMPTRLINDNLKYLNDISWSEFLRQHITPDAKFMLAMDYHMKDDFGADSASVSALAGLNYFICRPYYTQPIELFSPPEGNYYFAKKLAQPFPKNQLLTGHLVSKIITTPEELIAEVIDVEAKTKKIYHCQNIIYAGHKHALPYIYDNADQFDSPETAPWLVVNVIMSEKFNSRETFWQNEMLTNDKSLMGFVDSAAQHSESRQRVLTVYYCLKPEDRTKLKHTNENKADIATKTIGHLTDYFGEDVSPFIKHIFIKPIGHAMPIPTLGYLFKDNNTNRKDPRFIYAGVDNGRLPLFFEALDSGVVAAGLVTD